MRRHVLPLAVVVSIVNAYYEGGGHPQESRVLDACESCVAELNHSTGSKWTGCVVDKLLEEQVASQQAGSDEYFPLVAHDLDPFAARERGSGAQTSELLKNLLRNFSCDHADGGSQPVRSMTWEYQPLDPCADMDAASLPPYSLKKGFLPAGDDLAAKWTGSRWVPQHAGSSALPGHQLTVQEAQQACSKNKKCAGFTYAFAGAADAGGEKVSIHFKTNADGVSVADGWYTYKRRSLDCRPGKRPPPPSATRYQVDVLRESPPVYLVRDFVTEAECEHMTQLTIPKMERSVVFGGGKSGQFSQHRKSYSVNMYPNYDDEGNVVTRVVRRKFAFAREVAEYDELVEGEGQEPLNSVYYKDWEDQYRPHCDGECYGGPYRKGGRIATSLTYCEVASKGGYTLFTRSNLKVVPRVRDMLFFGYKLNAPSPGSHPTMDAGHTEHSGCPLREGTKWSESCRGNTPTCRPPWLARPELSEHGAAALLRPCVRFPPPQVATMWYREGMTAEKGWEAYRM